MKENILKAFTLLLFVSLVVGFVIYRAGVWEEKEHHFDVDLETKEHKQGVEDSLVMDSLRKRDLIMSSSKSMVIDVETDSLLKAWEEEETQRTEDSEKKK